MNDAVTELGMNGWKQLNDTYGRFESWQNECSKIINISKENNFEKIGEYVEEKMWVKVEDGAIVRKLTDDEFKIYKPGDTIGDLVRVIGHGYVIHRNWKTKKEYRVVHWFS